MAGRLEIAEVHTAYDKADVLQGVSLAVAAGSNPDRFGDYQRQAEGLYNDIMSAGGLPTLQLQITPEANDEREDEIRRFFESQVHQDYGTYVVDGRGTTATTWLRNWLAEKA